MNGGAHAPCFPSAELPPLARKSKSLDALPKVLREDGKLPSHKSAGPGCTSVQSRSEREDAPDIAGVPVFVMLPLDTVSPAPCLTYAACSGACDEQDHVVPGTHDPFT